MTFPNVKESGLYGRSLFAHLQKENDQTPVLVWSLLVVTLSSASRGLCDWPFVFDSTKDSIPEICHKA